MFVWLIKFEYYANNSYLLNAHILFSQTDIDLYYLHDTVSCSINQWKKVKFVYSPVSGP